MSAPSAHAGSRSFVEIRDTQGRVDEALLRRLVALELADVSVPPNPRFPEDRPEDVVLYCRVTPEDDSLRVEVWDRGESAGARRVSLKDGSQIVARRVALAASELARRLVRDRRAEALELAREVEATRQREKAEAEQRRRARLALTARGAGILLSDGGYLLGPELGAQLNRDFPLRVELALRWLGGQLTSFEPNAGLSAAELSVAPSYVFVLDPKWELSLGVPISVAMLHMRDDVSVDHIPGESDTWTARVGAGVHVAPRISSHVRFDAGLEGGFILRPVPMARGVGSEREVHELDGGYAALTLGILVE